MRTRIAVVAALVILSSPASAQWRVDRAGGTPVAAAAGTSQQITIGVACRGSGHAVLLTLPGAAIFDNGAIEARWDDGSTDSYSFEDQNQTLLGAPGITRGLVRKLRRLNSVTLHVTQYADVAVSDTISLSGSSRAIGGLPCGAAARAPSRPAPSRQRLTATRSARDWLPRVRGGLDSPMQAILSQMPDGIQPDISMRLDRRVFSYRFPDGSQLILAFRPLGRGEGLVLDYVDVED